MGGCGQMLMFAYKVGGWVWQNTYVIIRIIGFSEKMVQNLIFSDFFPIYPLLNFSKKTLEGLKSILSLASCSF